jgi:hypothetical protein
MNGRERDDMAKMAIVLIVALLALVLVQVFL